MIPCYGTHGSRQRINNKSIQDDYKIWVLVAEAYGYVIQFEPYQGVKKGKQVASSTKWGLGENVALRYHIFSSAYPPWSEQHSSNRCAQQK